VCRGLARSLDVPGGYSSRGAVDPPAN
jgi:hypothetical protein